MSKFSSHYRIAAANLVVKTSVHALPDELHDGSRCTRFLMHTLSVRRQRAAFLRALLPHAAALPRRTTSGGFKNWLGDNYAG